VEVHVNREITFFPEGGDIRAGKGDGRMQPGMKVISPTGLPVPGTGKNS